MNSNCPVCKTQVEHTENEVNDVSEEMECRYSCQRCGEFRFEEELSGYLQYTLQEDIRRRAALSHWIRTTYERGCRKKVVVLDKESVNSIIKNPRPSLEEQVDNLVRWLGDNTVAGGDCIRCSELAIQAIVGAATIEEFLLVFNHLKAQGVITGERQLDKTSGARVRQVAATLSFPGVQRYLDLKRAAPNSRKAFMAMQYNEPQLDNIVENVFRDAVQQTGFDLFILRDDPKAGLIDDRLRVEIRVARLLIADLTHGNAGAYWEAGYAEGLGKPVIYTCEKRKFKRAKPHFDTNHHLTILWEFDEPENAAKELKATIRATLPAEAKLTDD